MNCCVFKIAKCSFTTAWISLWVPEMMLNPGVLGRELTSLTSVSSEVLPMPEQLSNSCKRSSCFKSAVSTNTHSNGRELNLTVGDSMKTVTFYYVLPVYYTYSMS